MEVMEDIEMLKGLAPEEENVLNKFGKVELTESELASIQHLGAKAFGRNSPLIRLQLQANLRRVSQEGNLARCYLSVVSCAIFSPPG